MVARVCRKRGPERDTDDPEALALAERVLKSGIALFPHKAYAHILYSNFLIEVASLYQVRAWGTGIGCAGRAGVECGTTALPEFNPDGPGSHTLPCLVRAVHIARPARAS